MARPDLRAELLAMAERDLTVRSALASEGSLFEGYHPRMEEVHRENAARLRSVIAEHGWPGITLVGTDGEEAAWLVVQHAIGEPDFLRQGLRLLKEASDQGEAPLWQVAMLEDRIRMLEGRKQRYGTQFEWGDDAEMEPRPPIEEPERVNERRRAMGLPDLEVALERHREAVRRSGERPPADLAEHRRRAEDWARSVGWREPRP